MPNFTGTLRTNEVIGSLYNMIINQSVFANPISGLKSTLVDAARVDVGLFGDKKLYYSTDALKSYSWEADDEAENLLSLNRPPLPKVQEIVIDVFRQIRVTVDNYMTKRAFSDEYTFSQFNTVVIGWVRNTKKIYDVTTYNAFIGTHKSAKAAQNIEVALTQGQEGKQIAEVVANTVDNLAEISRDYNDNGFVRAYSMDQLHIVFNKAWFNKVVYNELPVTFHTDAITAKLDGEKLHSKYFGNVNTQGGTTGINNTTVCALVENDYGLVHCYPGDLLPDSTQYLANETYTLDTNIICKIYGSVPFMSSIEVGTNFLNARSLTENHYLTWAHNTPEHLSEYPFITISKSE